MTIDTKGQPAVIGIDYADIRDFASAGVLTKPNQENIYGDSTHGFVLNRLF